MYPNPAKDIITIEHLAKTEQTVLNDAEPTSKFENNNTVATKSILETSIKSIEIIDLMGITRFKKICSTDKLNVITIPVDKLSNGIYLMKIFDGKESKIEKFIVQH